MLTFPNAKINLGLFITEKRNDGYHNLETVFYPIPLFDILEIVPVEVRSETILSVSGIPVPGELNDNLVLKAYRLLQLDFNLPPVRINLHKNIPMGAGLGGGSSDAAFCLINLNKQFNLNLTESQLLDYALELGSDCPFFIKNSPQFAKGRGEQMVDVDLSLKGYYLLLVFPDIHVSTTDAFATIQPSFAKTDLKNISFKDGEAERFLINDFESTVFVKYPELLEVKNKLLDNGVIGALMSGRGSSLFGIFKDKPSDLSESLAYNNVIIQL